jgi:AcrR family transcriptional regulator
MPGMTTDELTASVASVPTKQRILYASAELFRRRGYTGTGLKQISEASHAPFGSLYHHFPGGKEELGEDVIRQAGEFFRVLVESVFEGEPDLVTGVRAVFDGAAETVRVTDFQDACPIAVIALEVASTNERLRLATADVFESWIASATARFAAAGFPRRRARELALALIAALEGAFVLARAMRDTTALTVAGRTLADTVERELAALSEAA